MNEINTKDYAISFCRRLNELMKKYEYVGDWNWGDPAGTSGSLPTYEIKKEDGEKVWCTLVEFTHSGTGKPNRMGILATYPSKSKKSLGSVMATMVPYEFSRSMNTRAYSDGENIEIRDYGRHTVGKAGIKREDFFNYIEEHYAEKILFDEEDKKYVNVYSFQKELSEEEFVQQTIEFVNIISNFKSYYK